MIKILKSANFRLIYLLLAFMLCAGLAYGQAVVPVVANHLELTNDHMDRSGSGGFIAGTINNLNDETCDVVLRVNVYGASHTFLSNKVARRNALQPTNSWDFRIPVGPAAQSYEITSVRARWYTNAPGAY